MSPALPKPPRLARFATQSHFFVCGLLFASWGVLVPTVKAQYGLSEASLSWLMLISGIGAICGITRVGKWVARHGARKVVLASGLFMCLSLAFLLHSPGYIGLLLMMFGYGFFTGCFDVAMNAEAVAVEHAYMRPIMSSFHGFFSLGGMAGALIASFIARAELPPSLHLLGACAAGYAMIVLASTRMMPKEATHSPEEAARRGFQMPSGTILLLGLMAAFGLVGEGAMYDWSTLYMREELGSPQAFAALGYGAFSATMALSRFFGDKVRAKLGAKTMLLLTGWLSAIAMSATLALAHPWAALIGFGLVGIGFSNMVPVLFSVAARVPGITPAKGIAGVSSLGNVGMMMGPPLIGYVAHASRLSIALMIVAVFALAVALLTGPAMRKIEEHAQASK